jgi:beta-hydroxylase
MRSTLEMREALRRNAAADAADIPPELRNRQYTQPAPTDLVGRGWRAFVNRLETTVVRQSVLPDVGIYDNADFPWATELAGDWRLIRRELDEVMQYRARMPSFHEIISEVSTITQDDAWKTFFLIGSAMDCSGNAARCPETMRLLQRVPGIVTAFFSILGPGKHIPAHRGAYNGVLRMHLGLSVPTPQQRCRIRIGDEIRHWNEGEVLIFDDTWNHEVWNDTDGWRVVLFVDFARPLKRPWHWLNQRFIGLGPLAPFLREAGKKQKKWEKGFYKR